ncbi:MAG: YjbH domain-containing protein, partial [Chlamydiae bacterium CG10_big_fil_rev_8_21_14_0_10_42_34]
MACKLIQIKKKISLLFVWGALVPLQATAFESVCYEDSPATQLFRDLEVVELINKQIHDRLPLIINYQLQGGYFNMPSARTFDAGVIGFGMSYVPPYHIWSLGFQFFDHIETTGNYWIYKGQLDGMFGTLGFGDMADRAANLKVILLKKDDGIPILPEFALGLNDFLGTRRFRSFYAVATKEFLSLNFEATLGWGTGRIQGFYGGLAWTPFRAADWFIKNLTLLAEYDANNYKHHSEEHSKGRVVKSRINAGLQFTLWDVIRLSGSTLRGTDWAGSIALNYNLGNSKGIFPKVKDPEPYCAPVDTQPLGVLRSRQELAQELAFAFQEQGFDLYSLYLVPEEHGKNRLWMKIVNVRYREEREVRRRIEHVLAALTPSNISTVTAVTEADGVPIQEYRFRVVDLKRYAEGRLGENEFSVIAPAEEVSAKPKKYDSALLYQRRKATWILTFRPWFRSFLGSSRGKFKYEAGLAFNPEGYLFDQIYYNICGTYTIKSSAFDIQSTDFVNPSEIINVRTDSILYNQSNSFHLDQAYVQKTWNMG